MSNMHCHQRGCVETSDLAAAGHHDGGGENVALSSICLVTLSPVNDSVHELLLQLLLFQLLVLLTLGVLLFQLLLLLFASCRDAISRLRSIICC